MTDDATKKGGDDAFPYTDISFADIQMLRYKVEGFEQLSLREKTFIYYLQEAAIMGRDILFDQNGCYNLRIRRMLETVYTSYTGDRSTEEFKNFTTYLRRVWFSSGIHHHYGCEKFVPGFSEEWLRGVLKELDYREPGMQENSSWESLMPVIFDPAVMPMRVNQRDGDDLVRTSAANYYGPDVTQAEAEQFYAERKATGDPRPVMNGMNSRLIRNEFGLLEERVWRVGGLYGTAIERIVEQLEQARHYA
ncbi:MAG: dihydrofolate reductase, partial [Alloprevotella sp.]